MTRRLVRLERYYLFFFNDTATTDIYPLSLHDALPISLFRIARQLIGRSFSPRRAKTKAARRPDRKSTRLNSRHGRISYAVFCLSQKNLRTLRQQSTHLRTRGRQHAARPEE